MTIVIHFFINILESDYIGSEWLRTTKQVMYYIEKLKKYIMLFICSILVGIGLLLVVYSIPEKYYINEIIDATCVLEIEGTYPELSYNYMYRNDDRVIDNKELISGRVDNFTNSLILQEIGYSGSESLIEKVMWCPHYSDGEGNKIDTLVKVFRNKATSEGESYARYWHGYLVIYKLLMLIIGYNGIRRLCYIGEWIILLAILGLLIIRKELKYLFPVVATYIYINPRVIGGSLGQQPMFFIIFLQIFILLLFEKKYRDKRVWSVHFFIIGGITAYIDYLTFPLVGLLVPLVFLLSYYGLECTEGIVQTIKCSITWGVGYLGLWASKWILASLLTSENVIYDAINTILYRTKGSVGDVDNGEAIRKAISLNYCYIDWLKPFMIVSIIAAIVLVLLNIRGRASIIWMALIAIAPIVWYVVCANHSYIHYWFTYRTLSISVFVGGIMIAECTIEVYQIWENMRLKENI